MLAILVTIFLIASILLIAVLLLKEPGDEGMGQMFGGGGNSKSYSKSKLDPVEKLIRTLSIIFCVSCLVLVITLSKGQDSVLDREGTPIPAKSESTEPSEETPSKDNL